MSARRKTRRARSAARRTRRRILTVVAIVALIVGVHVVVDDLSRPDWPGVDGKANAFAGPEGGAVLPGASGGRPAQTGVAAPSGMDPALRQKAAELRKRYADRLSRMSAEDKMRALNKARQLFGRDPRTAGR